ncbi:heterokaryon incompatibility protein-domain-containing protein [Lineolata rhizophorae]|uniref:Heterokaryon incompatibility protein-domain-containing protein n=1 Tax=Lineolata rhizophorae TaxID=578093 RepID=A0A6A6P9K2_9PEZI|nr:heterokaryon incompatibility protein-domain-containing protein [Lineolata rhizophorae]
MTPDDPATGYGVPHPSPLPANTASAETHELAEKWILNCLEQHNCSELGTLPPRRSRRGTNGSQSQSQGHSQNQFADADDELFADVVPARLIDLRAFGKDSEDARLIDVQGECGDYVALSYCWGKEPLQKYTTTESRLGSMKKRIVHDDMPRTFRDAFAITRKLGVRYVWIDGICIVQDSNDDWETESAKMGAIYGKAYVTVAADSSTNVHDGCFNQKSRNQIDDIPGLVKVPNVLVSKRTSRLYIYSTMYDLGVGHAASRSPFPIEHGHLSQRGWAFQERLLSPRTLHYTDRRLHWECRQEYLSEDNMRFIKQEPISSVLSSLPNLRVVDILSMWHSGIVMPYSKRHLSRATDRLPALSGLAHLFSRYLSAAYIAGIWSERIADGLAWYRSGTLPPRKLDGPSFTWSSQPTPVVCSTVMGNSRCSLADHSVVLAGQDPFGAVAAARLKMRCRLRRARVWIEPSDGEHLASQTWVKAWMEHDDGGTPAEVSWDCLEESAERERLDWTVFCLLLFKIGRRHTVLLLEQVDVATPQIQKEEERPGPDAGTVFRRRGIAKFRSIADWFNDGHKLSITLI